VTSVGVATEAGATTVMSLNHSLERVARSEEVGFRHLTKTFGSRTVLKNVSFSIASGEVVALLGQNGSGKSTLIKMLAGYHEPDSGSGAAIVVGDEERTLPLSDRDARYRIAVVHQDLALLPTMSVAENLMIDRLGDRALGRLSWRQIHARAAAMLKRVGAEEIDPRAEVSKLRPLHRAMVAIARAMDELGEEGLLILDEVTAFLTQDGIDQLFEHIREVTGRGISVLFVSHRIEEVWRISTRAVVLRNGELVADVPLAATSLDDLVSAIVGERLDWLYPEKHPVQGEQRLRVRNVRGGQVRSFELGARAGEIVGLTGLRGMGHERVVYALYGEMPGCEGTIAVGERPEQPLAALSPHQANELGIRLIPSERLLNGALAGATVRENASLPLLEQFVRRGLLSKRSEREWAWQLVCNYGVSPADTEAIYSSLSGGNQQKVLVGRWLETAPEILLLDEPTQGVDVGARREIFSRIVEAARSGVTVLYSTSEIQDLAELCHRVLVFRDGVIAGQLEGTEVTEDAISRLCWAGKDAEVPSEAIAL